VIENWDKDIPIWQHKIYRDRPVLNGSERMILAFRRWYTQFYDDRSILTEESRTSA
jgi:cholesterol 7-dehydrogenase